MGKGRKRGRRDRGEGEGGIEVGGKGKERRRRGEGRGRGGRRRRRRRRRRRFRAKWLVTEKPIELTALIKITPRSGTLHLIRMVRPRLESLKSSHTLVISKLAFPTTCVQQFLTVSTFSHLNVGV